jgi:UDP:flavonoid glycosyltransferase YjiC (YdhE family)
MRFLLEPCNNTLSHVAKCLALRDVLTARGHEVFLAVSADRARFLDRAGIHDFEVLPDIQEADRGASPSFSWFRPARVEACIRAELGLLRRIRPDRVLGVFRFTGPLSAALAGVTYDSLICGCMTPACLDILGFSPDEPGAEEQATALTFFRRAGAHRIQPLLSTLGLPELDDLWQLLTGNRTFLWDFPAFQPLGLRAGYQHVGPLRWSGWPRSELDERRLDLLEPPIAFVAFGTGAMPALHLHRVVAALRSHGYTVALALGGQRCPAALSFDAAASKVAIFDFLPTDAILDRAALVVCHGGQGLIFEAMRHALPILVIPFQPEQAQNGLCVERMGCGSRLLRGTVFDGGLAGGRAPCPLQAADVLADELVRALAHQGSADRRSEAAAQVRQYGGVEALATRLEADT